MTYMRGEYCRKINAVFFYGQPEPRDIVLWDSNEAKKLRRREPLACKTQILVSHFLDIPTVVFSFGGLLVLPPWAVEGCCLLNTVFFKSKVPLCRRHAHRVMLCFCSNVTLQIVTVLKYIFLSFSAAQHEWLRSRRCSV